MKRYLDKFKEVPHGASIRNVITREWVEAVQGSIRALSNGENISTEGGVTRNVGDGRVRLGSRPRFQPLGRAGSRLRFEFLGISKSAAGVWQVRVGPGVVNYNRLMYLGVFQDLTKGRVIRGIYPKVDTGAGTFRIDHESKPGLPIGSRSTGAVWLKCEQERCSINAVGGHEAIVLTERGKEPDGDSRYNHVLIAEFDIETTGAGAAQTKTATNVYTFLQSDWTQGFLCEEDDSDSDSVDDSIDSSWPFSDSSSDDSLDVSDNSGSSDDEEEEGGECEVKMTAVWTNVKTCFTPDNSLGPYCIPKEYIFEVKVRFWFKSDFGGVACQKYAYGVKFPGGVTVGDAPGGSTDEYVWQNDTERTLKFKVASPAACQKVALTWRLKTFPAVSGFGGLPPEDKGCCGQTFTGTAELQSTSSTGGLKVRKLPQVCGTGCKCSGSSDSSGSSESAE